MVNSKAKMLASAKKGEDDGECCLSPKTRMHTIPKGEQIMSRPVLIDAR